MGWGWRMSMAGDVDSFPEDQLVRRAQLEIPQPSPAFDAIVARYRPRVLRRAIAILGDPADADDVCQEVFLRVFRALPRYQARGRFAHWLERIVTNTCRMSLRARRRHERRIRLAETLARGQVVDCDYEARLDVGRLLARLTDANGRALVMRAALGLSYREIAGRSGISMSAAKMRVKRGRDGLRAEQAETDRVQAALFRGPIDPRGELPSSGPANYPYG